MIKKTNQVIPIPIAYFSGAFSNVSLEAVMDNHSVESMNVSLAISNQSFVFSISQDLSMLECGSNLGNVLEFL